MEGLLAFGADGHQRDLTAGELLQSVYIGPAFGGQVLEPLQIPGRSFPPPQDLVNRLTAREGMRVPRGNLDLLTPVFVGDRHREVVEIIQNIAESQGGRLHRVHPDRVTRQDRIEPAATSGPSGGRAILAAPFADPASGFPDLFRWERARPDAARVGLEDTQDPGDSGRANSRPGARPSRGGAGGGDEGIGAMVQVQQRSLGTLEKKILSLIETAMEEVDGVGDEGFQRLAEGKIFFLGAVGISFRGSSDEPVETRSTISLQFLSHPVWIPEVTDSQSQPGDLRFVGGPDPPLGGPDLPFPFGLFALGIQNSMLGEDDVGSIADPQVSIHANPGFPQPLDLLKDRCRVDDDAIPHHRVVEPGSAFLQKPFALDALARKVRSVLDGA